MERRFAKCPKEIIEMRRMPDGDIKEVFIITFWQCFTLQALGNYDAFASHPQYLTLAHLAEPGGPTPHVMTSRLLLLRLKSEWRNNFFCVGIVKFGVRLSIIKLQIPRDWLGSTQWNSTYFGKPHVSWFPITIAYNNLDIERRNGCL